MLGQAAMKRPLRSMQQRPPLLTPTYARYMSTSSEMVMRAECSRRSALRGTFAGNARLSAVTAISAVYPRAQSRRRVQSSAVSSARSRNHNSHNGAAGQCIRVRETLGDAAEPRNVGRHHVHACGVFLVCESAECSSYGLGMRPAVHSFHTQFYQACDDDRGRSFVEQFYAYRLGHRDAAMTPT